MLGAHYLENPTPMYSCKGIFQVGSVLDYGFTTLVIYPQQTSVVLRLSYLVAFGSPWEIFGSLQFILMQKSRFTEILKLLFPIDSLCKKRILNTYLQQPDPLAKGFLLLLFLVLKLVRLVVR